MDIDRSKTPPGVPSPGRKPLRRTSQAFAWVLLGLALGAAFLGWRLTQGPIPLPEWTVARIEARIGRDLGPRALSLGQVALAYDLEAHALRLRIRGMRLREGNATLVLIPDARVALDGAALLRGKLRPRAVRVDGLAVDVARDAEGRFSLAFGSGGGALPATWPEALDTLDAALATPVIAALTNVEVTGVALNVTDAITGLRETVEDGTIRWARADAAVRLSLGASIEFGGRRALIEAALARTADTNGTGGGAEARVSLRHVSVAGLAQAFPGIPAFSLGQGELAAEARFALSADGVPSPLHGVLTARDLRMADRATLRLDRARVEFEWPPGSDRIEIAELAASSDEFATAARGQVLLENGLVGPVQVQLRLNETLLDPDGLFDRRVEFDEGVITARLTQRPLSLQLGQAVLTGPSGTARLSGRVAFPDGGPDGALRLEVPHMAVDELLALWPPSLTAGARRWLAENLQAGLAQDAAAILRLAPGRPAQLEASFAFTEAMLRYMRDMPPAEGASGAAQLSGERFAVRVDRGVIPAVGPDGVGGAGALDVAGTSFTIPDARQRPPEGLVDLRVRGAIDDMLLVLDNPPFSLLQRLGKDANLTQGEADARVAVRLPLRPGNAPADVAFAVDATLRNVESRRIVPGRMLAGRRLALHATAEVVSIAGAMTLEDVPFRGRWEQRLPPPSTVPSNPDGPPAPAAAVSLPAPGRVTGTARLDAAGLARLGVSVAALTLQGESEVSLDVALPQSAAPRLALRSDLRGARVGLPAIGWTKGADRPAEFALEATLGAVPEVEAFALEAPGLSARGSATFRPGGALEEARFSRVDTGWFRGPLVLSGRGAGAAPAIRIAGGTADLQRALAAVEGGEGEGAPVEIALDRLQITEGIALTELRTTLRNGAGQFRSRINGGAQISGAVGPDIAREGTAVQATAEDAGGVLRSAGLFADGAGGRIAFTLRPTRWDGVYDGAVRMQDLRVRNAPALASLLQTLSVVGILEQLTGEGLFFPSVEADFTLRPGDIVVSRASAVGPSMSITGDGRYDIASKTIDIEGVISPVYLVNGLFGALFSRRDEGLFGFTYRLAGLAADPLVSVNPLSILTPGAFREIFRRPPPS